MASSRSVRAGSGSKSMSISAAAWAAISGVAAATAAIRSPSQRTTSRAKSVRSFRNAPYRTSGTSAAVMTAWTPGRRRAAVVSIRRIRAWGTSATRSAPWSIPVTVMSAAYRPLPVTLSRPSWRMSVGAGVAVMLCSVFDGIARSRAPDGCGTEDIARPPSDERRARRTVRVARDPRPGHDGTLRFARGPSRPCPRACRRRRPAGRRDLGHRAAGLEPGRRPAARRRRVSGVGGRRRRDRALRRRARPAHRVQRRRPQRGPDRLERGTPCSSRPSACAGSRSTRTRRRARVEAGVLSKPLAIAAGEHGLAYLAGTSPDVGVLGYALGGGLSWMIRTHGLACNTIVAADVVTADGRLVRVDRDTEPELFWALRGGGGNVAAVTAMELELFPVAEIYAGRDALADRARDGDPERLARVDRDRARGVRVARPDAPAAGRPVPARARARPVVRAGRGRRSSASAADGAALVQPLRDLGPGDRHRRDDAAERAERGQHGPGGPAALLGRGDPARRTCPRRRSTGWSRPSSDRRCCTSRSATSAARPRSGRRTTACSTRSTSRSSPSPSGSRPIPRRWRPWTATSGACSARSGRGTAAGAT